MSVELKSRRDFLKTMGVAAIATSIAPAFNKPKEDPFIFERPGKKQPNFIIVLADDMGFGDLGAKDHKMIKTPNIDRFFEEGMEFSRFYVAPVCSPTRAGLLTGRAHYRTGVTNVGSCGDRIKMDETTIAKTLGDAGYETAIFGKWHLGDNYPMRPQDLGFKETVIHKSCCLTPWDRNDPPGENYYDPLLYHNGVRKQYGGYCMDVYTDLSLEYAATCAAADKPFFIYLSTNTPHGPLNVAPDYSAPFKAAGSEAMDAEYYGTISNLDDNIGRLVQGLKDNGLDEETLVIFLTDNGNASGRYGDWGIKLRGKKADVYEGGIRIPCAMRWPGVIEPGTSTGTIASYMDLMPTLLNAANVQPTKQEKIDGSSVLPLALGKGSPSSDRKIIIQWHQGLQPQLNRSFTIFNQNWKLVQAQGGFHRSGKFLQGQYLYELFDIDADPAETKDLAAQHPDIVKAFHQEYEDWFWEVMRERGPDPQEIFIGSPKENPCVLMASGSFVEQDEHPNFGTGEWPSRVLKTGKYDIKIHFRDALKAPGVLSFRFGKQKLEKSVRKRSKTHTFKDVDLSAGSDWLLCHVRNKQGLQVPTYIEIDAKFIN
ncbi:MAG: arylsulfatase [Candidatus Marinimicrobia bacterium]|jgi:arylsulfatase A|nr:arylsulfatase [Candidatus Neomarinimicrobiota bacterium]